MESHGGRPQCCSGAGAPALAVRQPQFLDLKQDFLRKRMRFAPAAAEVMEVLNPSFIHLMVLRLLEFRAAHEEAGNQTPQPLMLTGTRVFRQDGGAQGNPLSPAHCMAGSRLEDLGARRASTSWALPYQARHLISLTLTPSLSLSFTLQSPTSRFDSQPSTVGQVTGKGENQCKKQCSRFPAPKQPGQHLYNMRI